MGKYEWVVSEYSQRQLTYSDDIEKAFQGVQNVLKLELKDFQYGLPISYLDIAVLWRPHDAFINKEKRLKDELSNLVMDGLDKICRIWELISPQYKRSRPLLY